VKYFYETQFHYLRKVMALPLLPDDDFGRRFRREKGGNRV
jgi:hypothetical protein